MAILDPCLPQEISTNILLRLPAKSIGRCRCILKALYSLLYDPQFIKTHLTHHQVHDREKLISINCSDGSLITLTFINDSNGNNSVVLEKLIFSQIQDNWGSIFGSCNGLVLALNEENSMFLVNPTTLELLEIPDFFLALDRRYSYITYGYGFGYDSSAVDYKIVTLSYYNAGIGNHCASTVVDVYSVKKGIWRRLKNYPHGHSICDGNSGIFKDGAIHWLASSIVGYSCLISTFDLAREEFKELQDPSTLAMNKWVSNKPVVLSVCLGIAINDYYY